jgi:patatin-related protein
MKFEKGAIGMPTKASVAKEYRFSVVMYGGVSLAVYMNGVAQELWHLVRSTARSDSDDEFRFCDPSDPSATPSSSLRSTEMIYRGVARALNDVGVDDVRFIVDVISGTSAGGINGIFLAKALTDDALDFGTLQRLWIDEGALEKLLNDKQTWSLTKLPNQESPRSLLCSDRMYIKLLDALRSMKPSGATGKPLCKEIDLFVTTTDITGRVIPLRLADMLVWERKYKEDFHLQYNMARDHDDLAAKNDPFVAFVARCTSSFPFAFEPMQLSKVQELQKTEAWPGVPKVTPSVFKRWERIFFDNTEQLQTGSNFTRAFGDGGYLNNKPFSYVMDMLGRHSSSFPTERKLIYVEPTPEHPEWQASGEVAAAERDQNAPNALVNSYDALIKLPGYQPIHDDLQRVIERNRLVRKVTELSAVITSTIRQNAKELPQERASQQGISVGDFSYIVLRVYSTTDELSKVVSEWFGYAKSSSYYYAIRCLVRAWRENGYEARVKQQPPRREELVAIYRDFLGKFDFEYEKRKYRFIRQQINAFYGLDNPAGERLKNGFGIFQNDLDDAEFRAAFRQTLCKLKQPFDDASRVIGDAQRQIRPRNEPGNGDHGSSSPLAANEEPTPMAKLGQCMDKLEASAELFRSQGRADDIEKEAKVGRAARRADSASFSGTDGSAASAQTTGFDSAAGRTVVEYVLGIKEQGKESKHTSVQADQDESYVKRAKQVIEDDAGLRMAVQETAEAISATLQGATEKARAVMRAGIETVLSSQAEMRLSNDGAERGVETAVELVDFFETNFEQFDTALFPLLYDTDVGTPELIGIIRVSPEDATALYDQSEPGRLEKLAGASLAHFGAFLDRSFRTNDILWGRLDGAERIIRALLGTDQNNAELARNLIDEAQVVIIQEFLSDRQQELAGLIYEVAKSLDPEPDTEDAKVIAIRECVQTTIASLPNQNFAEAVEGFLTWEKIRDYLKQGPIRREPDRRTTLESITRTVRIVGGILQSLGTETKPAGGILIRAGAALWWLVQAAIPGGLTGNFVGKIFAALFWFGIVMVFGGTFLNHAVQSVGFELLFITTLLWFAKDTLQRYIRGGRRALRFTTMWMVLALLVAAGAWTLIHKYQQPEFCKRSYQYVHDLLSGR